MLDVGCGQGHAVNLLAGAFPRSRFVGIDFSPEGVEAASAEAAALGLRNSTFEVADATEITGSYDLVTTFDVIHDLARPRAALAAVAAALRPGGVFLMGDIAGPSALEEQVDNPLSPMLYAFSLFHCMTVSLAQGGEGLGTAWGEQRAVELLGEVGFTDVAVERLPDDPFHVFYIATRSA